MTRFAWRARRFAAALALACFSTTLTHGTASAAPAVHTGSTWSVTRVAGGFRVTLHLGKQLPVTASAPSLSVDGT